MTVNQLIAMLKAQPGEAAVYYDYSERERLEISGMFLTLTEDDEKVLVLESRV
jgi:hypothetical protein